jgi:glycosyltransferase involved in cell wall biosynthesis
MANEVSIIIPLYNKEDVIWRTLNSVFRQSYRNWECVIVDDGSTDKSLEVVQSFISSHPANWRILSQMNQGQAAARNNGMANANGEFLAFLDADDLWPPDKLSNQVSALEKDPNAVAVLSSYAIFGKNSLRVVRHSSSQEMMTCWLDMSGFGGALESVGLVRRSATNRIGPFDTDLSTSSGLDYSLRLSRSGVILILREVGLFYRLSQGQWHSNLEELIRNMSVIHERYSDMYQGDLDKSHSAYFFWAAARKEGRVYMASEFLKSLFNTKNGRARMLIQLITRNLKSSILGHANHRTLEPTLTDLDSKNSY